MKTNTKLTVDEFIEEYSKLSDGRRYELQDGEVLVSPEPGPYHGRIQALLLAFLLEYSDEHAEATIYGPTNVALSTNACRGPDITVTVQGDGAVEHKTKLTGKPAVLIEIVSPSNPSYDLVDKRKAYCNERVPEIWFFDTTSKEALFLTLDKGVYSEHRVSDGIFASKALTGLRIDVAALFELDRKRLMKLVRKWRK